MGQKIKKTQKTPSRRDANGVKNRKNAEKTQPEKSKWCEKAENREKYPIGGKRAGQKSGK